MYCQRQGGPLLKNLLSGTWYARVGVSPEYAKCFEIEYCEFANKIRFSKIGKLPKIINKNPELLALDCLLLGPRTYYPSQCNVVCFSVFLSGTSCINTEVQTIRQETRKNRGERRFAIDDIAVVLQ